MLSLWHKRGGQSRKLELAIEQCELGLSDALTEEVIEREQIERRFVEPPPRKQQTPAAA
jgi:hypothetical protein